MNKQTPSKAVVVMRNLCDMSHLASLVLFLVALCAMQYHGVRVFLAVAVPFWATIGLIEALCGVYLRDEPAHRTDDRFNRTLRGLMWLFALFLVAWYAPVLTLPVLLCALIGLRAGVLMQQHLAPAWCARYKH